MAMARLKSSGSGYSAELDEAERASRDEIMALQTKRLAWSLKHAYDNVAHYKKAFDAAGVHPVRFQTALRSRQVPVHGEDRPSRQLSLQHVRGAARKAGPRPRFLRHDRQADRGRIYPGRYRHLGRRDGALDPRRRRAHGHDHAQRLWLRPVHRRARRALRRRKARLYGGAGVRRHDRAAGATDQRFQARHHHGDAELHAGDPRRVQAAGPRSAQIVTEVRHLRRRALDQRDARRDRAGLRHGCHRHLRPVGSDRPRRGAGMRGDQGRPAHLGGSFLSRGDRSRDRRGAARRREGRAGVHLADQGGAFRSSATAPAT